MNAKTIRDHRIEIGWTQLELADRLGTTATTVYRWETLRAEPSGRAIRDMARVFDCRMEEIDLSPWDDREEQQRHRA